MTNALNLIRAALEIAQGAVNNNTAEHESIVDFLNAAAPKDWDYYNQITNAGREMVKEAKEIIAEASSNFEHFSGYKHFPVPAPSNLKVPSCEAPAFYAHYALAKERWEINTEYGRMNREYLNFLIKYFCN